MYIALHPFFDPEKTQLKYSRTELVSSFQEIKHPIFREVLKLLNVKGVDINSIADIPSGTGLGSSSSFTVGVLNTLYTYLGRSITAEELAAQACDIEINKLGEPIGKQDQYAAACGGLNFITFNSDDTVNVEKLKVSENKLQELQENLIMIYTGDTRSASTILSEQKNSLDHEAKFNNVKEMTVLARNLKGSLNANDIDAVGTAMHEGWQIKRSLVGSISSTLIDDLYAKGRNAGALGGKLLGAGGGGFLLFYCKKEKQAALSRAMKGFRAFPVAFDTHGSKVVYNDDIR